MAATIVKWVNPLIPSHKINNNCDCHESKECIDPMFNLIAFWALLLVCLSLGVMVGVIVSL